MVLTESLVTMGEVHTGLLHHSAAISQAMATRLLDVVLGERVRRSDRPISSVFSPPQLTGVDCQLPASSGARVRGVGTAVSRVTITGGHVVQGSAYVQVTRGQASRRLPWSHYLSRPGVVETVGKANARHLADGHLDAPATSRDSSGQQLDLGAIGARAMDAIQDRRELDHRAAFRTSRTRLRWVIEPPEDGRRTVVFGISDDKARVVRLPYRDLDVTAQAALCEDLALHDWLLTTLLSLIERSRIGSGSRSEIVHRLQPAVDYLLHLWMPAARIDQALADVWHSVEQRPGLSRQWQINVDRVRDQLALGTMEMLATRTRGS
jgi:hypothetical protein